MVRSHEYIDRDKGKNANAKDPHCEDGRPSPLSPLRQALMKKPGVQRPGQQGNKLLWIARKQGSPCQPGGDEAEQQPDCEQGKADGGGKGIDSIEG